MASILQKSLSSISCTSLCCLALFAGVSCQDTASGGQPQADIGVSPDLGSHDDASDSGAPHADDPPTTEGTWSAFDGPPGGVEDLHVVGDMLFAERGDGTYMRLEEDSRELRSWTPPAFLEGKSLALASYAETTDAGFWLVGQALYSSPADGDEWTRVDAALPDDVREVGAFGNQLYLVRFNVAEAAYELHLSADGGKTWDYQPDASPVVETGRVGETLYVIKRFGELVTRAADADAWTDHGDFSGPSPKDWVSDGVRVVATGAGSISHSSDGGLTWERFDGDDVSYEAASLVAGKLYAVAGDGRVGEVDTDGNWSPITQSGPGLQELVSTDGGFVGLGGGALFRWTPTDASWRLLEGYGTGPGAVAKVDAETFVVRGTHVFKRVDDGWRWMPDLPITLLPNSWSFLGQIDDTFYLGDGLGCLLRYADEQWQMVGQMGLGEASECGAVSSNEGSFSVVEKFDDQIFVGMSGTTVSHGGHGTTPTPEGGGLARLDADGSNLTPLEDGALTIDEPAVWVRDLQVFDDKLWLLADHHDHRPDVYQSSDPAESWQAVGLAFAGGAEPSEGVQFESLAASSAHLYAVVSNRSDQRRTRTVARLAGESWTALDLPVDDEAAVYTLESFEGHLYAATPGQVWLLDESDDTWQEVGEGLPDGAIHGIYADTETLYVSLDGSGLFTFALR